MSDKKIPMKRCEWANKSELEQSYHDSMDFHSQISH